MPKYEFEISITAPTQSDAIQKMKYLSNIGSKLNLNELKLLDNTVSNPVLLAKAKQELGL